MDGNITLIRAQFLLHNFNIPMLVAYILKLGSEYFNVCSRILLHYRMNSSFENNATQTKWSTNNMFNTFEFFALSKHIRAQNENAIFNV